MQCYSESLKVIIDDWSEKFQQDSHLNSVKGLNIQEVDSASQIGLSKLIDKTVLVVFRKRIAQQ